MADGTHPGYAGLDLGDNVLPRAREKLNQISPGGGHALVGSYQHPQSAGGGNLLAFHKVCGDVVGNLPGQKADCPYIRFLHSQVFNNGQAARLADSPAHVQLAGGLFHQLHMGILYIAPHVACLIGHCQNRAQWAAPFHLQSEGGPIHFQIVSHQRGGHQSPPQGGSGHREKGVNIPGPLHNTAAGNGGGLYQAVRRNRSYNFVAHDVLLVSLG